MSRKKAEQAEAFRSLRSEKGQPSAVVGEPRAAGGQRGPHADSSGENWAGSARAHTSEDESGTTPHSSPVSAAVTVQLSAVQLVGPDAAVVWAVMEQLGRYDPTAASVATGIPPSIIRQLWARASSYGYRLPDGDEQRT